MQILGALLGFAIITAAYLWVYNTPATIDRHGNVVF